MKTARLLHNVLTVDGHKFVLYRLEYEALLMLQSEPGIITYEMLATVFWNGKRPDAWIYVVRNAIGRLRKKLRLGGWDIQSRKGAGYTLERVVGPATDTAKRSTNGWKYVTRQTE